MEITSETCFQNIKLCFDLHLYLYLGIFYETSYIYVQYSDNIGLIYLHAEDFAAT